MKPSNLYCFIIVVFVLIIGCNPSNKNVKDGPTAFENNQFAYAIPLLKKEFNKEKDKKIKAKKAIQIATAYQKSNQFSASVEWIKKAHQIDRKPEYLEQYIQALIRTNQNQEALKQCDELRDAIGNMSVRRIVNQIQMIQRWDTLQHLSGFEINNYNQINTPFTEYANYFDGDIIYFTSDRDEKKGAVYKWTGQHYMDIYQYSSNLKQTKSFDLVNTPSNEGHIVYNKDNTKAIFVKCASEDKKADQFCRLFMITKYDNQWSEPEELPFQSGKINYTMPCFGNDDGSKLFFVSDDKDGWGGLDIYQIEKNGSIWGEPKVLPRSINSDGNEGFPFVDKDTLYFSSDSRVGMGGYDIYQSYLSNGKWRPAQNLKAPLNSTSDDFGYVINFKESTTKPYLQKGYFSSNREGGQGLDDIYQFSRTPALPDPEIKKPTPTDISEPEVSEGKILLSIQTLSGDKKNKVGLNTLSIVNIFVNDVLYDKTDENGILVIEVQQDETLNIRAEKNGFLNDINTFSSENIALTSKDLNFNLDLILTPIKTNEEIVLESIYYDYNKWNIRDDAAQSLDELAVLLNQNPTIKIQLNSHTDCRGKTQFNEKLSQKRAESAVSYLINKGILPNRLLAKGYGKSNPIEYCECNSCTDEQHQRNRRTAFEILSY